MPCCSFFLGQKKFPCPNAHLSGDKSSSKNSRTNSSVQWRPWTKPLSDWQKNSKKMKNWQFLFFFENCNFLTFFLLCSTFFPFFLWIFLDRTGCQNPVPARPIAKCQNLILACSLAKFWACPVVPLSRDDKGTSVPLSLCPGTMKRLLSLCPTG